MKHANENGCCSAPRANGNSSEWLILAAVVIERRDAGGWGGGGGVQTRRLKEKLEIEMANKSERRYRRSGQTRILSNLAAP